MSSPPKNRIKGVALAAAQPLEDDSIAAADIEIENLKSQLLQLAASTKRGFRSSPSDRQRINKLINALATLNPTREPAIPYYENDSDKDQLADSSQPTLAGKWTLVYTDAPDITGLDSPGPARLGRIGQECDPPYIRNVIEWKRPNWAANLPLSGPDDARVLQKVCTKAKASPSKPLLLELDLAGLKLETRPSTAETGADNLWDNIQDQGLVVGLLQQQGNVNLEGPVTAPFGKANILFLDEDFRILRTAQGFVAANVRSVPEWF